MTSVDPGDLARPLRVALIAGEPSGDHLGAGLMRALRQRCSGRVEFAGIGGPEMTGEGLASAFPLGDIAVMGPIAILSQLPRLIRRVHETVDHVTAFQPDVLVIIDSPEFTHPDARRVRKRLPGVTVVNYVSPTVWAWRPWRARHMRAYVDHVLAIFPFEPAVHARLGGPPCTYVGHPVVERLSLLPPSGDASAGDEDPVLLVLPGSRASEVERLLPIFGCTLERLVAGGRRFRAVLPAVAHLRERIAGEVERWSVRPQIVDGESAKWRAFAEGRVALAASGTVTLELALAGVPMVVGYRLDPLTAALRWVVRIHSVVMANLVIGENAFPEFIQKGCDPETLAAALDPLFDETPERRAQIEATDRVRRATLVEGESPSDRAAGVVLGLLGR